MQLKKLKQTFNNFNTIILNKTKTELSTSLVFDKFISNISFPNEYKNINLNCFHFKTYEFDHKNSISFLFSTNDLSSDSSCSVIFKINSVYHFTDLLPLMFVKNELNQFYKNFKNVDNVSFFAISDYLNLKFRTLYLNHKEANFISDITSKIELNRSIQSLVQDVYNHKQLCSDINDQISDYTNNLPENKEIILLQKRIIELRNTISNESFLFRKKLEKQINLNRHNSSEQDLKRQLNLSMQKATDINFENENEYGFDSKLIRKFVLNNL